MTSSV
jgi:hypothetical protein